MAKKATKTGKMPWQGGMKTYSGNTRGGTGTTFSAKGKSSGGKHRGCGCGGK